MPINDDLAQFVFDERTVYDEQEKRWKELHEGLKPGDFGYDELSKQYQDLGHKVLQSALTTYNRFIAFVRNTKGQYWLNEHPYSPSNLTQHNNDFKARVRWGDYNWFLWRPSKVYESHILMTEEKRTIRREEWSSLQNFVAGNRNPYIVHELLANSELLLAASLRRSAVIEAVSALEVALSNYARSPDISSLTSELRERIDVKNFHQQVGHLGLKGTVGYLLPLILSSQQLSTETLQNCQEAVEVRNTVIHRGQRDINTGKAHKFVRSIKDACDVLTSLTTSP